MPLLPVYNLKKEKVGTVELNDAVFASELRPHLVHAAVLGQISRQKQKRTAKCLTRGEVHGTTKKVYRQKGTGQARHGAVTAPIFVGGGKAHGPVPHVRSYKTNKKVMRAALVSVLSMSQKEDRLFVVDKLEFDKVSTKEASQCLSKAFGLSSALVVNSDHEEKEKVFNLSIRNLPRVKLLKPEGVNVFDVLKFKNLVLSRKAIQGLTERLENAAV